MGIQACKGKVIVSHLDKGEQVLKSGIILADDNGKTEGIHSRWAKVYSVGEDVTDIQVGEWILVEHGRWSRTIQVDNIDLNLVDYPNGVLAASPHRPEYLGLN